MKNEDLNALLKALDNKLNHSIATNFRTLSDLQVQKSIFTLRKLRLYAIFEIIVGALIMILLGNFIYHNTDSLSLIVSAAILQIFTVLAIAGASQQLILISEFEVAASVTENQRILASLQTHSITLLRLMILHFPFFLPYILIGFKIFFNINIWKTGNLSWLISSLLLSIALIPVSIWLYRKIQPANMHLKWVRKLVEITNGKQISEAMSFLDEIEKFKS